jgi:hypothetical protein
VVSAEKILEAHERLGASIKPIIAVDTSGDPSNHVLAGRVLAPNDTPRVRDWILAFTREIGLSTGSTTAIDATAKGTP